VLDLFSDADPDAGAHDYTAQIDWGGGSLSSGTIDGLGPFTVSGAHTCAAPGIFILVTTVSDHGGAQRSVRIPVVVASAAISEKTTPAPTIPSRIAPHCEIATPSQKLAKRARTSCDR
jgi:hypothetical protein